MKIDHKHSDYSEDIGITALTMEGKPKKVALWCSKCGATVIVAYRQGAYSNPPNSKWTLPKDLEDDIIDRTPTVEIPAVSDTHVVPADHE